ncbi:hypothetical protein TNCV_3902281 [Trichonephila clavipes]|nr:hypothetical protein TNCV_3902281 [Trichonephila clavipes]
MTHTRVSTVTIHRRPMERNLPSDEYRLRRCPDDHRRRIWRQPERRADPAFTTVRHTDPQQEVMVWGAISFEAGPLWSSLETLLQPIGTSTAF